MKRSIRYGKLFFSLLVVLLYSIQLSFSQTKQIDSLKLALSNSIEDTIKVRLLDRLSSRYLAINDVKNAILHANESLLLAKRVKFRRGEGDAHFSLGIIYRETYDLRSAWANFNNALKIREEMGDNRITFCYMAIARLHVIENNYPESIIFILKALALYEKLENKIGMAAAYSRLGLNYKAYGNFKEAYKYSLLALETYKQTNQKIRVAETLCGIGLLNLQMGNGSKAIKNILEALQLFDSEKHKEGIAYANLCLGTIYLEQGKIELRTRNFSVANEILLLAEEKCLYAVNYFEKHKIFIFNYSNFSEAYTYNTLGNIHLSLRNLAEAKNYLQKANRLALSTRNKFEIQNSYLNLFLLDSIQGNYKSALYQYKQFILFRDSIANAENSAKMESSQLKYEFTKKEDSLKQEHILTKVKLEAEQKQKYFYWIGLFLMALLAFLVFRNFRNQKKINQLADETHEREKAELELHSLRAQLNPHFMFNSLNAIQELILLEKNDNAQSYLARFAKLLRMLLENADRPFIPLQRELDFLQLYLSLENLRVEDLQHSIMVDPLINTEQMAIPNMILQPYIENAIWHGLAHKKKQKKLEIRITKSNGFVQYEIEDNGVGRAKSAELKSQFRKEHKSKGMELLSKRYRLLAREFGSDIRVEYKDLLQEVKIAGTRVTICVPLEFSEKFATTGL